MVSKCIWSYLSHFLAVLGKLRAEFKAISRTIWWDSSHDQITGLNWFKQVFLQLTMFFKI